MHRLVTKKDSTERLVNSENEFWNKNLYKEKKQ